MGLEEVIEKDVEVTESVDTVDVRGFKYYGKMFVAVMIILYSVMIFGYFTFLFVGVGMTYDTAKTNANALSSDSGCVDVVSYSTDGEGYILELSGGNTYKAESLNFSTVLGDRTLYANGTLYKAVGMRYIVEIFDSSVVGVMLFIWCLALVGYICLRCIGGLPRELIVWLKRILYGVVGLFVTELMLGLALFSDKVGGTLWMVCLLAWMLFWCDVAVGRRD